MVYWARFGSGKGTWCWCCEMWSDDVTCNNKK